MSDVRYIASISGGKDSIAMSLRLVEEGWCGKDVSEYIFADTGKEYPEAYEALNRFEQITGKVITRLKAKNTFEYYLSEAPTKMARKVGYGFPSMRMRWCTSYFKKDLINHYLARQNVIQLIGIAIDEPKRIKENKHKDYPLVHWKMTEADCLEFCKERGFYQGESPYEHINRMSCYCCPLCNNLQVKYLVQRRPELWKDIKHLEELCGEKWKSGTDYYERKFCATELDLTKE